jgi:molybdate transport system substrate-binding protein
MSSSSVEREMAVLSVAAAANLRHALDSIREVYLRTNADLNLRISYGSSGTLTQQILNGATFGLFLSADTVFPAKMAQEGIVKAGPVTYAYGKVALWSTSLDLTSGLASVLDPRVRRIAIANPKLAPYGKYSVDALQRAGVYSSVLSKIVWGENVSQAAQFVSSGNAELGFVALASLRVPNLPVDGTVYILSERESPPIAQAGVVLKSSQEKEATQFLTFLLSDEITDIWTHFGYTAAQP